MEGPLARHPRILVHERAKRDSSDFMMQHTTTAHTPDGIEDRMLIDAERHLT